MSQSTYSHQNHTIQQLDSNDDTDNNPLIYSETDQYTVQLQKNAQLRFVNMNQFDNYFMENQLHQNNFKKIEQNLINLITPLTQKGLRKVISLLYQKLEEKIIKKEQENYPTSIESQSCVVKALNPQKNYEIAVSHKKIAQNELYIYQRIQKVAKVFCERQFDYPALIAQLAKNNESMIIPPKRYVYFTNKMVKQSFRLLECFILYQCKGRVPNYTQNNKKRLFNLLLNYKGMLDSDTCLTFLKFVKIAYGLATVKFKQQNAVDLFNKINKLLFENIPLKKKAEIPKPKIQKKEQKLKCNILLQKVEPFNHKLIKRIHNNAKKN